MSDEDYSKAIQQFCKPAFEHQLNYYAMIVEKRLRNENPISSDEDNVLSVLRTAGNVLIDFEIGRNGELISSTINRASGFSEADNVAIAHLRRNLAQALHLFPEIFPDVVPFRVDYTLLGCGTVRQILTHDHFDMDKLSYSKVAKEKLEKLLSQQSIYELASKQVEEGLDFGVAVSRSGEISQLKFFADERKYKKLLRLVSEKILSCALPPLPDDFPSELHLAYTLLDNTHLWNAAAILRFEVNGEDFEEIMSRVSTYRD